MPAAAAAGSSSQTPRRHLIRALRYLPTAATCRAKLKSAGRILRREKLAARVRMRPHSRSALSGDATAPVRSREAVSPRRADGASRAGMSKSRGRIPAAPGARRANRISKRKSAIDRVLGNPTRRGEICPRGRTAAGTSGVALCGAVFILRVAVSSAERRDAVPRGGEWTSAAAVRRDVTAALISKKSKLQLLAARRIAVEPSRSGGARVKNPGIQLNGAASRNPELKS